MLASFYLFFSLFFLFVADIFSLPPTAWRGVARCGVAFLCAALPLYEELLMAH